MTDFGITASAISIPRLRLQRSAIAQAHDWVNPGLAARAKGQRAFCSSDEDAITMAVSAGNDCLLQNNTNKVQSLTFASTSAPFIDRQHATLIGEALNLDESITTLDVSSSMRAGTSALLRLLQQGTENNHSLLIASDTCTPKAGNAAEMIDGDGAAALATGADPIASFIAAESISIDLVDHYRTPQQPHNYQYEERWVRDEGINQILPKVIDKLLAKANLNADAIDHLVLPISNPRTSAALAKTTGLSNAALADNLINDIGSCGTAHPLVMLHQTLLNAKPDQTILLIGFGQGADAILLKTTTKLKQQQSTMHAVDDGMSVESYTRYLSSKKLLDMDWGMRAERDNRTAMSVYYRKRRGINTFIGGRCDSCETIQFPIAKLCVNPDCGAYQTQQEYCLQNESAQVKSFTEDWLAHSTNPPLKYGNVQFDNGANVMMEFTDFEVGELAVGVAVTPRFRIKDIDELRGFRRYFWKAAPAGLS